MTIPASQFVGSTPGVIAAAGSALSLNGLLLTTSTRVPIGQVYSFPTAAAVGAFFGLSSQEYAEAQVYFAGFDGSQQKPAAMLVAQYAWSGPVGAYLRGGNVSGLTLDQLKAITPGTLTVTVDGTAYTSSTITLSSATSFSNAASIIQTALAADEATATACSIAGNTLTVGGTITGTVAIGQLVTGTGVAAGTYITAGSGTSWTLSGAPQTVASESMTFGAVSVSYDSVSGAFVINAGSQGATSSISFGSGTIAPSLKLDSASGAVTSQGSDVSTPAAFMAALFSANQGFYSLWTTFLPVTADALAFAKWTDGQKGQNAYICWDTDGAVASGSAPSSIGAQVKAAAYNGTVCVYEPTNLYHAAFVAGYLACQSWGEAGGRASAAYRGQSGLTPGVTDPTALGNVTANGYNCYCQAGLINGASWDFLWNGAISGAWKWIDSYTDQALIDANFQSALMTLLTTMRQIPYNQYGYGLIHDTLDSVAQDGITYGAIQAGVPLSAQQAAEVNNAAGKPIDQYLTANGYYIQVLAASAAVRAARGTPPINFWYTDGESVQQINVASLSVQ